MGKSTKDQRISRKFIRWHPYLNKAIQHICAVDLVRGFTM